MQCKILYGNSKLHLLLHPMLSGVELSIGKPRYQLSFPPDRIGGILPSVKLLLRHTVDRSFVRVSFSNTSRNAKATSQAWIQLWKNKFLRRRLYNTSVDTYSLVKPLLKMYARWKPSLFADSWPTNANGFKLSLFIHTREWQIPVLTSYIEPDI